MAENKGNADKRTLDPRADAGAEQLRRESRHQQGARGDVTDQDVGEDRLKQKGLGGRGADEESVSQRRDAPPVSDKR